MNYNRILVLVFVMMTAVLVVQFYHSFQSYKANEKTVIGLVQNALDSTVEQYYINLSKQKYDYESIRSDVMDSIANNKFLSKIYDAKGGERSHLSKRKSWSDISERDTLLSETLRESIMGFSFTTNNTIVYSNQYKNWVNGQPDMLGLDGSSLASSYEDFKNEMTKIVLQVYSNYTSQNIDLSQIHKDLKNKLRSRNIDLTFGFSFTYFDGTSGKIVHNDYGLGDLSTDYMNTQAISTFLSRNGITLMMMFENPTVSVFKKSIWDLCISLFFTLIICVILMTFFKYVKKQKRIEEIKNSLISNITHELKTPIATSLVAIEGIQYFGMNSPEKINQYLNISKEQLKKLSSMVERILDSATLDSDQLQMSCEPVELVHFMEGIVQKVRMVAKPKGVVIKTSFDLEAHTMVHIDTFHMENALSNIFDNSMKYGGKNIRLTIEKEQAYIKMRFIDDGIGISSEHASKIFHQFYRIPKGNIHNTKGFGIGLFYTKNILERHGGSVVFNQKNTKETEFIVKLKISYE